MKKIRQAIAAVLCTVGFYPSAMADSHREVVIEGNETFSRRQLLSALRYYDVRLTGDFSETDADDAAFFLRQYYFDRGFPNAEVTYSYSRSPLQVIFNVDEGHRVFIDRIEFSGNTVIDNGHLRDIMTSAIRQATRAPFGRLRFSEIAVEDGLNKIRHAYTEMGYLNAMAVYTVEDEDGDERLINLDITIEEGPLYHFGKISYNPLNERAEKIVKQAITPLEGQPYTSIQSASLRGHILDALKKEGYYDARITTESFPRTDGAFVDIHLDISPGNVYTIKDIRVEGAPRTSRKAIRRWFGMRPGEQYNAAKADEGTRRLWFSGAFSEVDAVYEKTGEDELDVILKLEEGRAKRVRATIGYSQWEQIFGRLQYIDRNLLGTLNRMEVEGYASLKTYGGLLTLSNPYFLGTNLFASTGGFYYHRELPAYEADFLGGLLGFERRFSETQLTNLQVQYIWRAVRNTDVYGDAPVNEADYSVGALVFRQSFDRRNDTLAPMQGYILRNEVGIASEALLGDQNFFFVQSQATVYLPLRKITRERPFVPFFSLSHSVGLILPYGSTGEVPVPERFFLGGPDTVRSFQLDGMAPRDAYGTPIGGQAYMLANVEFLLPIYRGLYLVTFYDVGNLAPELAQMTWDETEMAIGAGLRFYTPIGAIRVEYGYNPAPQPGDPIGAWNFGFGFNF